MVDYCQLNSAIFGAGGSTIRNMHPSSLKSLFETDRNDFELFVQNNFSLKQIVYTTNAMHRCCHGTNKLMCN